MSEVNEPVNVPDSYLGQIVYFQYKKGDFTAAIVVHVYNDSEVDLQVFTSEHTKPYGLDGGTTLRTRVSKGNQPGQWWY